jgi:hypothetical protein
MSCCRTAGSHKFKLFDSQPQPLRCGQDGFTARLPKVGILRRWLACDDQLLPFTNASGNATRIAGQDIEICDGKFNHGALESIVSYQSNYLCL